MSHHKLPTVDNLMKKGLDKPKLCRFCEEQETIDHLFFESVVAKVIWGYASEYLCFEIGSDYMSKSCLERG
jgi:hypothetical protein